MPKYSYSLLTETGSTYRPIKNAPMFVLFVIGVAVGVSLALMYTQYQTIAVNRSYQYRFDRLENEFSINGVSMSHISKPSSTGENGTATSNQNAALSYEDEVHALENTTIATMLSKEVRVLCWVLTTPANHRTKAIHVKRTWGQRCNKLLFMSTKRDDALDSVALNVSADNPNVLWGKTKRAFQYIYENHRNDADWFMKADDDTYVILENLRYFLYPYSTDDPIYFGYKMNLANKLKHGYFSGGAGYVLSRNALDRFGKAMQQSKYTEAGNPSCRLNAMDNEGAEDFELGRCMEALGVYAGDTRDESKRGRFFLNTPEAHLIPGKIDASYWYWQYMWYKSDEGLDCCSDNAISFHYIRPQVMYVLDYLIYHLRPYGVVSFSQPLPKKVNFTEIVQQLEHERPEGPPVSKTNLSST